MNGAEILTKFTADTSGVDKATNKFSSSIGGLTKAFTLGSLAAKGISKAIGVFNSSLDGAIKRTDTLNNFPKVMSNLGIGAEEAEEAINTLSKKLDGLPTTLDSAASAVQRFTSGNGDVQKSTKYFLAVNNAILAGGASADIQASALEQLSQAYAKGKPDMMEWRTLMMAMPAQLKQVSQAMGYVDATALGEDLRKGNVSMDDFMKTIEKLNTQGVGDFASFEEQARNSTGGIQTSITNMKTAFIRGVSGIVGALDDSLKPLGGISGILTKIGKIGEKAFKSIGKGIKAITPTLIQIGKTILPTIQKVMAQIIPVIENTTSKIMPVLLNIVQQLVPVIATLISTILPPVIDIIEEMLPPLLEIIDMILPTVIHLIKSITPLLPPIINLLKPIIQALLAVIKPLVQILNQILPPLIDFLSFLVKKSLPLVNNGVKQLTENVTARVQTLYTFLSSKIDAYKKIFKGFSDFISGVFTGNWSKAWEGVKNIFSGIFDSIKNTFKTAINFIIDGLNVMIRGLNKIKFPDWEWLGNLAGKGFNFNTIPRLNTGTNYVPEDTLAYIHQGEAVVPKKFNPYANGINASTLGSMGGQNNIIININNDMKFDALGQMVNKVKTFSGGAKNDFNYGMGR